MGTRKIREGADRVYEAAQAWVDAALRSDSSLFTPGEAIWSSRWLKELREHFLDRPDVSGGIRQAVGKECPSRTELARVGGDVP